MTDKADIDHKVTEKQSQLAEKISAAASKFETFKMNAALEMSSREKINAIRADLKNYSAGETLSAPTFGVAPDGTKISL